MRRLTPGKKNLSCISAFLIFLWRLFMLSSRAVAIALFVSHFQYWIIPIGIAHWGVMTVWVMHQGTNFCSQRSSASVTSSNASNSRLQRRCQVETDIEEEDYDNQKDKSCQEYFLNMVIGILYLFCYIPVKDEPSRWKYTFFYVITFCENTVFTLSWFYSLRHLSIHHHHLYGHQKETIPSLPSLPWFALPALVFVFGCFFLGLFFQLLYYRYFHPNGKPLLVNRAAKCC